MIAAQSVSIQFGGEYLFRDVNFMISPGERIGLVGANGAGKTTLMRALLGVMQPDEGVVQRSRHAVIGYLPQEGVVLSDVSVREEVMQAFAELVQVEQEIEETINEIAARSADHESPEFAALLDDLGELQHRYEAMSGFSAVGEVEKVLMGLGFEPDDLDRPCREFSGGWQMRIELAKLLLRQPDLLMLDEPTNHLDIESLLWLENFLSRYQGSIVMISHDRAFLDGVTNRTFELGSRRLTAYTGNYSRYLRDREQRRELQQSAYENQQREIAETEKFIERFRYKASKARQVQSRIKSLERIERVDPLDSNQASVHFAFPPAPRSGRVVIEVKGLHKYYDDNHVLRGINFALDRGDKIAFLGRNGEGKSTLSRILAGIEGYQEGERTLGHNVSIGYFAQHQAEQLDPRRTVLETLDSVAIGDIRTRLRSLLGAFLFQGDDVFKPIGVLSGGEKSRVALAKLMLEPTNLLVFDEPTNHLDMLSKDVLKRALIAYDGALVIVSHDRDFLEGIVGKCLEFRNGGVKEFPGGVGEYLLRQKTATVDDAFRTKKESAEKKDASANKMSAAAKGSASPAAEHTNAKAVNSVKTAPAAATRPQVSPATDNSISPKERKRLEAERRNRLHAVTKELRNKLATIERTIAGLEQTKKECEERMADPATYSDADVARDLKIRMAEAEQMLVQQYEAWSRVASEIEEKESGVA